VRTDKRRLKGNRAWGAELCGKLGSLVVRITRFPEGRRKDPVGEREGNQSLIFLKRTIRVLEKGGHAENNLGKELWSY